MTLSMLVALHSLVEAAGHVIIIAGVMVTVVEQDAELVLGSVTVTSTWLEPKGSIAEKATLAPFVTVVPGTSLVSTDVPFKLQTTVRSAPLVSVTVTLSMLVAPDTLVEAAGHVISG
jgi:hypothetical protein